MLTADFKASIKSAPTGAAGALPGQPMSPEQFQSWAGTAPKPAPSSNVLGDVGNSMLNTAKSGISTIGSGLHDLFTPPSVDPNAVKEAAAGGGPIAGGLEAGAQALKGGVHAVAGLGKVVGGIGQTVASPILGPASMVGSAIGNQVVKAIPEGAAKSFESTLEAHPEIGQNTTDIANISNLAVPELTEKASPTIASGVDKATNLAKQGVQEGKNIVADAKGAIKGPELTPEQAAAQKATQTTKNAADAKDAIDTEVRNLAAKYPTVGKVLNAAEAGRGTDPISVLASYASKKALPTLTKGKLQVDAATNFIKQQIGVLSKVKSQLVETGAKATSVDDFTQAALDRVDKQSWSTAKKNATKAEISRMAKTMRADYPEGISNPEMDLLKTEHAKESNTYTRNPARPFALDTDALMGQTAADIVQSSAKGAPIDELNKLISSHYDAIKLLGTMRGKTPHGGMLTHMFNNTLGEVAGLAGGIALGHPFIGAMAGRAGAEAVSEIINSHFISNPLKRSIIDTMKDVDPEVVKKAKEYLDATGDQGSPGTPTPAPTEGMPTPPNASTEPKSALGRYLKDNPPSLGLSTRPTAPKIPADDLNTMSDFTDYVAKSYKPSPAEAHQLELAASRIWEKYLPNKKMPKTLEGLSNEFGRILEQANFGKGDQPPLSAPKGEGGGPNNAVPKADTSGPFDAAASKQIADYRKEGIFLRGNQEVTASTKPLSDFNGETIRASQNDVGLAGVKRYQKQIEAGARPSILIEETTPGKYRIVDGHTRLTAYKRANVQDIPVLIRAEYSPSIPKELEPLAAEARKYKSADAFIKAQGRPLYHGSSRADLIRQDGFKLPTSMAEQTDTPVYGDGVYFSSKRSGAYDHTRTGVNTIEGYLPKDLNLFSATEKDAFTIKTQALKKQGYDGVEVTFPSGEKHVVVFDPANITTKEQLASLYDQVHGTATDLLPHFLQPLKATALQSKNKADFIAHARLNGYIAQALGERFTGTGIEGKLTDFYNKVKGKK